MNIGVVGTGMIAKLIVPHLGEWGIGVAAVSATPDTIDQARELAAPYGATAYASFDELLQDSGVDTVYLAVPNHLHAPFALKALAAGKHVIVEKPFATTAREAERVADAARAAHKMVFEAISTLYLPNYHQIRAWLPRIGRIRMVSLNYSQYSSRYNAFRAGQVLPAFDPACAGGALMDLGLYNIQYLIGLFGEPREVTYHANIERGIDTSGVATFGYDDFCAVSVAAKDCAAPTVNVIQGTEGYIQQVTPANRCGAVTLHLNDGTQETFDQSPQYQWEAEFRAFAHAIDTGDTAAADRALEQSLAVARTLTTARHTAGVRFPMDEE